MDGKMARVLIAAPASGSGKTMVTCGLIAALKRRQLNIASFKCGPDYIDPMFHRRVLGVESGNLDTYFTDADTTRYLLARRAGQADVTIMEGVMGYYDGIGGTSCRASAYEVACVTDTPVVLVINGKGASVTLAAVIQGVMQYRADSHIQGIILNQVSPGYYVRIKTVIERDCGVAVLGYVPVLADMEIPSRHLGLVAPEEIGAFESWTNRLADVIEKSVDMDALLHVAKQASDIEGVCSNVENLQLKEPVRLGIARDEAFSFYYAENQELLTRLGAELVYFSPIHDRKLPEDIDGVILWGGYPENYAGELSGNETMRESIREACENGMPCLAECGGFLYLQRSLEGADGKMYDMTGVLSGHGYRTERLVRFGYMEAEQRMCGDEDNEAHVAAPNPENLLLGDRCHMRGHEFHYWDCTECGDSFTAWKPSTGKEKAYSCMVHTETLAAGFPHFYYYSNPDAVYHFLKHCEEYRSRKNYDRQNR